MIGSTAVGRAIALSRLEARSCTGFSKVGATGRDGNRYQATATDFKTPAGGPSPAGHITAHCLGNEMTAQDTDATASPALRLVHFHGFRVQPE